MTTKARLPEVGALYHDGDRELAVSEVIVGEQLGREVIGTVRSGTPFGEPEPYSCSLLTWEAIWHG